MRSARLKPHCNAEHEDESMARTIAIAAFLAGVPVAGGFAPPLAFASPNNPTLAQRTKDTETCLFVANPALASALASKLYPASMIGTLGEAYFRTRDEMECPRGAAAGYFAQIATVIVAIPLISIAKNAEIASFLEVDWLHFIEAVLFWASIHVQCMSFRQAVRSVENGESLPRSAVSYLPTVRRLLVIFGSIVAIAAGHFFANPDSWQHTQLFGGMFNPPTPGHYPLRGELSFLTWVFHWTLVFDYCNLPRYLWRWADVSGNERWKLYSLMHLPAFFINAIVVVNHLHRDQIVALKMLHPILVFVGSLTTLFGAFAVARANGWAPKEGEQRATIFDSAKKEGDAGKDWDTSYSMSAVAVGALLSYGSLYLSR